MNTYRVIQNPHFTCGSGNNIHFVEAEYLEFNSTGNGVANFWNFNHPNMFGEAKKQLVSHFTNVVEITVIARAKVQ
jgi:hypothetical protein